VRLSSISLDFFVSIVLAVSNERAFGLEWGSAGSNEQAFGLWVLADINYLDAMKCLPSLRKRNPQRMSPNFFYTGILRGELSASVWAAQLPLNLLRAPARVDNPLRRQARLPFPVCPQGCTPWCY